jgi:acylphosphatase
VNILDNTRIRLIIEGRVQGVWFRDSTRRKAKELGVYGWVTNRDDGGVEVLAEGTAVAVENLKEWCRKGPPGAIVRNIIEIREEWQGGFDSFDIVF